MAHSLSGRDRKPSTIYTARRPKTGYRPIVEALEDRLAPAIQGISVLGSTLVGSSSSTAFAVSPDGRYVAFESSDATLVAGDTNNSLDVFLRDTQLGTTIRVSTASGGVEANGGSQESAIAVDSNGNVFVAFVSYATNLTGDVNIGFQVFVKDVFSNVTTMVSTNSASMPGSGPCFNPTLAFDGDTLYVAFESLDDNLVLNDNNSARDIFVKNMTTGAITRVSTDSNGIEGDLDSVKPAIAIHSGTVFVAFQSDATNLVPTDLNNASDIFVNNLSTGDTTLVSSDFSGVFSNSGSASPTIASDSAGNVFIAFSSTATNLATDNNSAEDVFLKNMTTGAISIVSTDGAGNQGNGGSRNPSLVIVGGDNIYVAFESNAQNLVAAADGNSAADVFVKSVTTGVVLRVSNAADGSAGNSDSTIPSLAVDASGAGYVAFVSVADNLVSGDMPNTVDVFLWKIANIGLNITGVTALTTTLDTSTATPFSNVKFWNLAAPLQTLTVSVTLNAAMNGIITAASLTASGFTDQTGGVYGFVGTAAQATTAIRQLEFDPTDNQVLPGNTVDTTFTITVDDGATPVVNQDTVVRAGPQSATQVMGQNLVLRRNGNVVEVYDSDLGQVVHSQALASGNDIEIFGTGMFFNVLTIDYNFGGAFTVHHLAIDFTAATNGDLSIFGAGTGDVTYNPSLNSMIVAGTDVSVAGVSVISAHQFDRFTVATTASTDFVTIGFQITGTSAGTPWATLDLRDIPELSFDLAGGDTTANGDQVTVVVPQVLLSFISNLPHVSILTGMGDDRLNLQAVTIPSSLAGLLSFDGGAGTDTLDAECNSALVTLTNTGLSADGVAVLSLMSVENAFLFGGAGNNTLDASAFSGDTTLNGGAGNDVLKGGAGNDVLTGGLGIDLLNGGAGINRVRETGNFNFNLTNTLLTGMGNDTLVNIQRATLTGGAGPNNINAAAFSGAVILDGLGGTDTLFGGNGNDVFVAGPGVKTIMGGGGTDTVRAQTNGIFTLTNAKLTTALGSATLLSIENAELTGGTGNDTFIVTGWTRTATINGAGGVDTIISVNNASVTNISDTLLTHSTGGAFTLSSIETARLTGGASPNTFNAATFSGSTFLSGGAANDTFIGGLGSNTVVETGLSFVLTDTSLTGLGTDTLTNIQSVNLTGSSGDNILDASAFSGFVILDGGAGNDTIKAGGNGSRLTGGAGNDTFFGGDGFDTLVESANVSFTLTNTTLLGNGSDTFGNLINQVNLTGGVGANTFIVSGYTGTAVLDGAGGTDTVVSINFNDTDFTLTANQLTRTSGGAFTLASIESVRITGGTLGNSYTIDNWLGAALINGMGGNDTLYVHGDSDYTLTDASLTRSRGGIIFLAGIEEAHLQAGISDNTFMVSGWTGSAGIQGLQGTDRIISVNDANFTANNFDFTRSSGGLFQFDPDIEILELTGGAGNNIIDAASFDGATVLSGGLGNDTLIGGTGSNTVREVGNVNFTLTGDTANATQIGLGTDTLTNIQTVNLTGGIGNNTLDASGFSGFAILNGGLGNDILKAGFGGSRLTGGLGNDTAFGGAGFDTLAESANVNFTLTNTTLTGNGSDTLDGLINQVNLTGGLAANTFNVSGFSGAAVLDGAGGTDTVASSNDADFTLTPTQLIRSTGGSISLTGIENASLTGGVSNNTFDLTAWLGTATLTGGGVSTGDKVIAAGANSYTLANTLLTRAVGGKITLSSIKVADLTGASGTTFTISGWTGSANLTNGSFGGRIVSVGAGNVTLSDSVMTRSAGGTFNLSGITSADLTGDAGVNLLNAANFTGFVTLNGAAGNDVLTAGAGFTTFNGGAGDDTFNGQVGLGQSQIRATGSGSFTLTNTTLSNASFGADTFSNISNIQLTGGALADSFNVSGYTGTGFVFLSGGAGADTVVSSQNAAFVTLDGFSLAYFGGAIFNLAGIENAVLTGGTSDNTFTITDWLGTATVNGGAAGTDTLMGIYDANFVVTNTSVARSTGGTVTFSNIDVGALTGGAGNNTFTVTGFTGPININGAGGIDTIVSSNNANFTLTDTLLTRSTGGTFNLNSIEAADLTGGASDNTLDASGFSGFTYLNGGAGNDTLKSGEGGSILVGGIGNDTLQGDLGRDLLFGGTGMDTLTGNGGEDLLFSGAATFESNRPALNALNAYWGRIDLDFATRFAQLRSGVLAPAIPILNAANTPNDLFADTLTGGGDLDWYFFKPTAPIADTLIDLGVGEAQN